MNHKQTKRLYAIISLLIILGSATALILYALKQNINLFYTPTQLFEAHTNPEQNLRIGGYVKKQSVHYDKTGEKVNFIVTDRVHDLPVSFNGVLPSLFREGQVVVITGKLTVDHVFAANEVLAKHDEKYKPKSLEKELKTGDGYGT